ncbi:Type II secretory pathway, pseudopilin PulG [Prosthecobacter debontii]|uniref:Type II secretory pathway, pseudopilin PulG n=1 Tax=Prosthecobacter debontii TaxID=48467 RepID=A0A1T4XK02_9BACT|nr:type II secretion system protein [Prosthecobacter debontii]SKA89733.1 Type II secretory pathway, pseudopilin PulG [Prosthecobacter debontii]
MPPRKPIRSAFTFVEAIFTIAIIGIMAALAVSAISNGARDANRIVARQQQSAVQEAVNAWVMSQTRVRSSVNGQETAQVQTLSAIRAIYNALPTTSAKFEKLRPDPTNTDPNKRAGFLDATTVAHFDEYKSKAGSDKLISSALYGAKQYLTLPAWEDGDMPRVVLMDE